MEKRLLKKIEIYDGGILDEKFHLKNGVIKAEIYSFTQTSLLDIRIRFEFNIWEINYFEVLNCRDDTQVSCTVFPGKYKREAVVDSHTITRISNEDYMSEIYSIARGFSIHDIAEEIINLFN